VLKREGNGLKHEGLIGVFDRNIPRLINYQNRISIGSLWNV